MPWLPGDAVSEDRYLITDFGALGALNGAAVSGSRQEPHDAVARQAADGAGGVYRLVQGEPSLAAARQAAWFQKPEGVGYDELDVLPASVWLRQMVLGPTPECCRLAAGGPVLPPSVAADVIRFEPL